VCGAWGVQALFILRLAGLSHWTLTKLTGKRECRSEWLRMPFEITKHSSSMLSNSPMTAPAMSYLEPLYIMSASRSTGERWLVVRLSDRGTSSSQLQAPTRRTGSYLQCQPNLQLHPDTALCVPAQSASKPRCALIQASFKSFCLSQLMVLTRCGSFDATPRRITPTRAHDARRGSSSARWMRLSNGHRLESKKYSD
jgi:hypothetical protein